MSSPSDPELELALSKGDKIAAIKRYRELRRTSLSDSKDAVEAMMAGTLPVAFATPALPDASDDPLLREALFRGNKIEAIKRYRELHGVGLAEAKDVVEALVGRLGGAPRPPSASTFEASPFEASSLDAPPSPGRSILVLAAAVAALGALAIAAIGAGMLLVQGG